MATMPNLNLVEAPPDVTAELASFAGELQGYIDAANASRAVHTTQLQSNPGDTEVQAKLEADNAMITRLSDVKRRVDAIHTDAGVLQQALSNADARLVRAKDAIQTARDMADKCAADAQSAIVAAQNAAATAVQQQSDGKTVFLSAGVVSGIAIAAFLAGGLGGYVFRGYRDKKKRSHAAEEEE